ncbi:hypothetical protein J4219_02230 [Candidatus Woesearchaeota archaeon]|nr:hypothetical protein [Candidatus Woesearchaeota archaeon]
MPDVTISLRVDKQIHQEMKRHDEINWSAVLRKGIVDYLAKHDHFDAEKARKAAESIDSIRQSGIFDKGRPTGEILREWRDKRKF